MVANCHRNLVLFLSLVLLETLLCQPVLENEPKTHYQDINEQDLRFLIAKTLSRHPLGILGHIIIEAVDKAGNEDMVSVRDRRYSTNPNDQSFLRFGRSNYRKRPKESYDLKDTSFLRFGRSSQTQNES